MEYDEEKVDEMVLALLNLGTFRGWAGGPDLERLRLEHHGPTLRKGFIHDPKSKARSVILTEEGKKATRELFGR